MKKLLIPLLLVAIVSSCGSSNDFFKQKYTNLSTKQSFGDKSAVVSESKEKVSLYKDKGNTDVATVSENSIMESQTWTAVAPVALTNDSNEEESFEHPDRSQNQHQFSDEQEAIWLQPEDPDSDKDFVNSKNAKRARNAMFFGIAFTVLCGIFILFSITGVVELLIVMIFAFLAAMIAFLVSMIFSNQYKKEARARSKDPHPESKVVKWFSIGMFSALTAILGVLYILLVLGG